MSVPRTVLRLMASLVLALLVLPAIDLQAQSVSLDFSLCVRACNELRRECSSQGLVACVTGQGALSVTGIVDCALNVTKQCTVASRQCKVTCVPVPEEP